VPDLADDVQHHVAEERHELFPNPQAVGEEKLDELGDEMEQMVKDCSRKRAGQAARAGGARSTEPPPQSDRGSVN